MSVALYVALEREVPGFDASSVCGKFLEKLDGIEGARRPLSPGDGLLTRGTDMQVRLEHPDDLEAIREVNRLAFGQEDEGRLVDALRAGGYARLSLVAEQGGRVIGHVLFSDLPLRTERGTVGALALAPMAVIPSHQKQGVGTLLVREGLRTCAAAGHRIVVVVGHPDYYPRFGFSAELAERLKAPFSGPAFMAVELVPGALAGVAGEVRYPPPFQVEEPPARAGR